MIQKRDFIRYILLSIVTCGIYGLYVWYTMTEDMNKMFSGDGKDSPNYIVVILLSIVTCGIYPIIWYYQMAERIQQTGRQRYNLEIKEGGLFILLWIALGYVSAGICIYIAQYFLLNNFNLCAGEYNRMNGYSAEQ